MDIPVHIEHIRSDGALLADAAERAGLDAEVPFCPDWQVRDLVRHQGDIHRWAVANLTSGKTEPLTDAENDACVLTWPDADDELLDWFRDGHTKLVEALETISDDAVGFTFLPAPSARAFWARRQAHETAIHRADAESASGEITPYDAMFAADGIDEVTRGFASRPGRLTSEQPRTLLLAPSDVPTTWALRIGPQGLDVVDDPAAADAADCTVRGTASDLFLFGWNRLPTEALEVHGDATLLELWPGSHKVRWGGPSTKAK